MTPQAPAAPWSLKTLRAPKTPLTPLMPRTPRMSQVHSGRASRLRLRMLQPCRLLRLQDDIADDAADGVAEPVSPRGDVSSGGVPLPAPSGGYTSSSRQTVRIMHGRGQPLCCAFD